MAAPTSRSDRVFVLFATSATLLLLAGVGTIAFSGWSYYLSAPAQRFFSAEHRLFSARGVIGLACGVAGAALFLSNLFYLPRRRFPALDWMGAVRYWLNWHVISGLAGAALVALHAAFEVRSYVGATLVWSLVIVVLTGIVGRTMVRFIPRTSRGELMSLQELQDAVIGLVDELRPRVQDQAEAVAILQQMSDAVDPRHRKPELGLADSLRVLRTVHGQMRTLARAARHARIGGSTRQLSRTLRRVRRLYRQIVLAHALSRLLDSWRPFHRVLALLFLIALALHIGAAFYYGFISL